MTSTDDRGFSKHAVAGLRASIAAPSAAPAESRFLSLAHERTPSCVDKRNCVFTRMELDEAKGRLRKTLEAVPESVRRSNGHWIPREMVMEDEKTTADTRPYVRDVKMEVKLPEHQFETGGLGEFQPL